MTVYFVSDQKARSINANHFQEYKARLQNEFSAIAPIYSSLPLEQKLYSKLVYIHLSSSNIDVDNMSKPFIDAFRGIIYPDDSAINHRVCSKIKFDELSSYEVRLDSLPNIIAGKLDTLISEQSQHILFFEVGPFSPDMVSIGGKSHET